jgi:aminotransferase
VQQNPSAELRVKRLTSDKADRFTESVIREMTRQALLYGAINLAQGFPDFPAPEVIKRAAQDAIAADLNQYAITWGAKSLRQAIARQMKAWQGLEVDPETEITVCCGSTEAMLSSVLAVTNPGEEIVLFEPFYENYGPDAILSGARPRFVKLRPSGRSADPEPVPRLSLGMVSASRTTEGSSDEAEWTFDPAELRAAFNPQTKAIILNTPNNPTGKVFTRAELEFIRDLCVEFNALAITDEIYEHILYDGHEHISIAHLDGMRERTITINGMSKTYSVTGWRVGWAVAAPPLTAAIRKVHDFVTVGAAAPLQEAGVVALSLPPSYYRQLAEDYRARRDLLLDALQAAGFRCFVPRGAYYIMTDISAFLPLLSPAGTAGGTDDVRFTQYLVKEIGVAVVPGSSFYNDPRDGSRQVRFAFCKKEATLAEAGRRLGRLRQE